MISPEDLGLFRITDDVDEAVDEIQGFYRVFHSQRYVVDSLVFRLRRPLSAAALAELARVSPTSWTAPPSRRRGRSRPRTRSFRICPG